jgi:hypothetical protein
MRILTLLILLASPLAIAGDITTPEALKASSDLVVADDMARCAGLVDASVERVKAATPKDEALIADLQKISGGYAAVALFYIKSHFHKNHIADDPEDWVRQTANIERIATMMFLPDADLRKDLGRCDTVDLPVARATALQLRDSK